MKRVSAIALGFAMIACAGLASAQTDVQWTNLVTGNSLAAFDVVGNANWKAVSGVFEANNGVGFLVTKESYADFEMKLEFWVDDVANSGVFIRCSNPKEIGANNSYEVNIFDNRPGQEGRTGAIVNVAPPSQVIHTIGKWNTYEIRAEGSRLIVTLNGVRTVDVQDTKYARGPIALQRSAGVVKFRNVQIRRL